MKAKQAKQTGKLLAFAGALLALVAVIMIFLPQIAAASENSDTTYNGLAIAFGKTLSEGSLFGASAKTVINFSFMNLLTYILVLAGLVISILQAVGICQNKLLTIISAIALVAGGILFFFPLEFSTVTSSGSIGSISSTTEAVKFSAYNTDNVTVWKIGYGAIVGGITAIVAGVCNLGKAVIGK